MSERAEVERTEQGVVLKRDGWHVVNAAECQWARNEKFGWYCNFAGEVRWERLGVNIHVVEPGQPACHYHRESEQEDFLVLSGECLVVIENEEIPLRAWDFVHCPAGTDHVFVGAGDGPCAILMIGARPVAEITYPVSEPARRHGASVETETHSAKESYANTPKWEQAEEPPPWPPAG